MKHKGLSSTADVFARRGDPWVSEKEGRKDFGRILDLENVDRDAENHRLSSKFWDKKIADELRSLPSIAPKKRDKKKSLDDKRLSILRKLNDSLDKKGLR